MASNKKRQVQLRPSRRRGLARGGVALAAASVMFVALGTTAWAAPGGNSANANENAQGPKTDVVEGQGNSEGNGANVSGPYDPTGIQGPGPGNGHGNATGIPCDGCVGNADTKNPPGQLPGPEDGNVGYECEAGPNHGVGIGNPAHTTCGTEEEVIVPTTPPTPTVVTDPPGGTTPPGPTVTPPGPTGSTPGTPGDPGGPQTPTVPVTPGDPGGTGTVPTPVIDPGTPGTVITPDGPSIPGTPGTVTPTGPGPVPAVVPTLGPVPTLDSIPTSPAAPTSVTGTSQVDSALFVLPTSGPAPVTLGTLASTSSLGASELGNDSTAVLSQSQTSQPRGELATTGLGAAQLSLFALGLAVTGCLMVSASRRRLTT